MRAAVLAVIRVGGRMLRFDFVAVAAGDADSIANLVRRSEDEMHIARRGRVHAGDKKNQ